MAADESGEPRIESLLYQVNGNEAAVLMVIAIAGITLLSGIPAIVRGHEN